MARIAGSRGPSPRRRVLAPRACRAPCTARRNGVAARRASPPFRYPRRRARLRAEHTDEALHGRLRIDQVAQDEARMDDVVCRPEIRGSGGPYSGNRCCRRPPRVPPRGRSRASLRRGRSDNAPGVGSPGELQRDVAPSAADIEAVRVLRDSDAIEQFAGAGRHDPRDEAQPLAPLWPAPDDVGGLTSHDHILLRAGRPGPSS